MNGMDAELYELSGRVGDALKARKLMMAAAESCTGGWIGQAITMVPGSSKWFDRGFVTYTDEAKQDMLGVSAETLKEFGAVSEQTVREMVAGAIQRRIPSTFQRSLRDRKSTRLNSSH